MVGGKEAGSVEIQDGRSKVVIKEWVPCTTLADKGSQDENELFSYLLPSDWRDACNLEALALR